MGQTLVKLLFDTGNAFVVYIGVAEEMGKQVFVRINAFFAVFKLQTGNAQIVDLILLGGRKVTFDINETPAPLQFGQNVFIADVRQNAAEFGGGFLCVQNFLGLAYRLTVGSDVAIIVPLRSRMSARFIGFAA